MKFSFFSSAKDKSGKPNGTLNVEQLIEHIRSGTWRKQVEKVRSREGSKAYRLLKEQLPSFSGSAVLTTRSTLQPIEKRLVEHSGRIWIDVDGKDNPRLRVKDLVDKDALCQFVSPGGKGIKICYPCKKVRTAAEHRRIFDAVVDRLVAKGVKIKVDPVVKSLANLQFVSYDPEAYYNPKTKLVIQPLPPVKPRKVYVAEGNEQLKQLDEYILALGKKDITKQYEDWLNVLFGLSYSFGETGRKQAHALCRHYPGYSENEVNEKYDGCLENSRTENPITVSTVFQLINAALPVAKRKELGKKYNPTHAQSVKLDEAEDITESPDLAGFVRYKLWLFKKIVDRKTNEIVDLQLAKINSNALESALRGLGLYRYQQTGKNYYVQIINNVVETVDTFDVLEKFTAYVRSEGNYAFTYGDRETNFEFKQEELELKWRELRIQSTMATQIAASLPRWQPDLLEDMATESYVPYRNGIAVINAKEIKLVKYGTFPKQVWKEQILPRDFQLAAKRGLFEHFSRNLFPDPEDFRRYVWYYGYVLQGTKRESTARAWLLYDKVTGNNGRVGKSILGKAAGKIRPMKVIDGQRADLTDRFVFQSIDPWTKIGLIDDVKKGSSLRPMFAAITGDTTVEKKNLATTDQSVKWIMTSNWILEAEGASESGRQYVTQVGDFYSRWGIEHGNTTTPVVDYHGKELFTDFDDRDWNAFDSFSLRCLQTHLSTKAPENVIVGNSKVLRFIQVNEEEMYFNLCLQFVQNANLNTRGWITVSIGAMNEALREVNEGLVNKRAGAIIRSFFAAIGARYEGISSDRGPSGQLRKVYLISSLFGALNFGGYEGKIGKPGFLNSQKGEIGRKTKKK